MNISELCYELYKVDWKRLHITPEIEMYCIKDYYENFTDDSDAYAYGDYIFDFGYDGMIYADYCEFSEEEYLDKDYICGLLDNEKLIELYLADIR